MYQNLRLFIYWTLHMCNGVQIKKLDSEMELEIGKQNPALECVLLQLCALCVCMHSFDFSLCCGFEITRKKICVCKKRRFCSFHLSTELSDCQCKRVNNRATVFVKRFVYAKAHEQQRRQHSITLPIFAKGFFNPLECNETTAKHQKQ